MEKEDFMKKITKLFLFVGLLVLSLTFASCTKKNNPTTTDVPKSTTNNPTSTPIVTTTPGTSTTTPVTTSTPIVTTTPGTTTPTPATTSTLPEVEYVTIIFDSKGGSSVEDERIEKGSRASKPTDPIKEGYVFAGWYLATSSVVFDFESTINESITLEAKWEKENPIVETYTVSFDNCSFGEKPNDVVGVNALPNPLPVLTNEGYLFKGWSFEKDSTELVTAGALITKDVTLYAIWEEISVVDTINLNLYLLNQDDVENSTLIKTLEVEKGSLYEVIAPEVLDSTFISWFDEDGRWHDNKITASKDLNLYGLYLPNSYTLLDATSDGFISDYEITGGSVKFANSFTLDPSRYVAIKIEGAGKVTLNFNTAIDSKTTDASKKAQIQILRGLDDKNATLSTELTKDNTSSTEEIEINLDEATTLYFGRKGNTAITLSNLCISVLYDEVNVVEYKLDDTYLPLLVFKNQKLKDALNSFENKYYDYIYKLEGEEDLYDTDSLVTSHLVIVPNSQLKQFSVTYMDDDVALKQDEEFNLYTILESETKEGYTFSYWFINGDEKNIIINSAEELIDYLLDNNLSSINLYAKFIKIVNISLFVDDELYFNIATDEETEIDLEQLAEYIDPKKVGYRFKGWLDENDNLYETLINCLFTSDTKLVASFEKNKYQITIDVDGGIFDVDVVEVEYNDTFTLESPEKNGYDFAGWYKDSEFKELYNFENKVTESFTLYAKWIEKAGVEYITLTINLNGGEYNLSTENIQVSLVKDSTYDLEKAYNSLTVKRQGYNLLGWYVGDELYSKDEALTIDTEVKAIWEINTFSVKFFIDDVKYDEQNVEYNNKVIKPNDPEILDYIFVGWFDIDLEVEFDFDSNVIESFNLYAKIESIYETASFDNLVLPTTVGEEISVSNHITYVFGNSSTLDSSKQNYLDYNGEAHISEKALKTGGASTSSNKRYFVVDLSEYTQNIQIEIYAFSESSEERFIYVSKDKIDNNENKSSVGSSSANLALIKLTLDYGHIYYIGSVASNVKFVAINIAKASTKATVNFDVDGGSEVETLEIEKDNLLEKPDDPTKEGYNFVGWYIDSNFDLEFDFENTKVNEDITLYAKWEIIKINVTLILNGGTSSIDKLEINYNTIPTLPAITKVGYKLRGWYLDEEAETKYSGVALKSHTTLYAIWDKAIYKVTLVLNGGSASTEEIEVEYNETVTLPDVTKENAEFIGWYKNSTFTEAWDNSPITASISLYVKWQEDNSALKDYMGYAEGLYVEFVPETNTNLSDYEVYYKLSSSNNLIKVDSELIRDYDTYYRVDVLGLEKGKYDIEIHYDNSIFVAEEEIEVDAQDRSGYAHFNNASGVGAYDNNGVLKENTVVVYVNDSNKNTVQAVIAGNTYTGLANILKAQKNSSVPLLIRILGTIKTTQWNYIDSAEVYGAGLTSQRDTNMTAALYNSETISSWDSTSSSNCYRLYEDKIKELNLNSMSNDIESGITKLDGLTSYITYAKKKTEKYGVYEFDSYFNMLDVANASNITIEGVGTDAKIFQWGFTFTRCNSIEVKNILFDDYTEDAIGIQGGSKTDMDYSCFWLHNCTFNLGQNNWDVSYENDKMDGDGSTDFKYAHNLTISYCLYNNTHKTNLVGNSDTALQYNITLHHNFYNGCQSRLPLLRQANVHMYNNYYLNCSTAQDIRENAFAFSEANYFEGCNNAQIVTVTDTYTSTIIKSFNDYFSGDKNTTQATVVLLRTDTLSGNCMPDGTGTDYSSFDTNSTLFYFDSENNLSDVLYLTTAEKAKRDVMLYAGSGVLVSPIFDEDIVVIEYTVTFNNNGSVYKTEKVNQGNKVTKPENPTKEGIEGVSYVFNGWYTDENLTTAYDFDREVSTSFTLYASFSTYKLSYETNKIEHLSHNTSYNNGIYFNKTLKEIYNLNSSFDDSGLTIYLDIDGVIADVSSDVTFDNASFTTVGTKTVMINYNKNDVNLSLGIEIYVTDIAPSIVNDIVQIKVDKAYSGTIGEVNNGYNMFKNINQALTYLKNNEVLVSGYAKVIEITEGTYNEKLEITIPNLTIKGAGASTTIIEWDSLYGLKDESGFSHITDSTFTVAVREEATNVKITDLTISNYYNDISKFADTAYANSGERGVALLVQADQFVMKDAKLLGWQDTLYLFTGRQYFKNVFISGCIDYIFGTNSTTLFDECEIHTIKSKGNNTDTTKVNAYITAFKGANVGASDSLIYGAIFNKCNFTSSEDYVGKYAIARPWAAYSALAIINSTFDSNLATEESKTIATGLISDVNLATLRIKFYGNSNSSNEIITLTNDLANVDTTITEAEANNYLDYGVIYAKVNGNVNYNLAWDPINGLEIDNNIYYIFHGNSPSTGTVYTIDEEYNDTSSSFTLGSLTFNNVTRRTNGNDDLMVGNGTITFSVVAKTTVTITSYPGYYNYKINDYYANNNVVSMYFDTATNITISSSGNIYCLYSIVINSVDENEASSITSISLSGYPETVAVGNDLDLSTLRVKVNYSNGTYLNVTEYDADLSKVDNRTSGTYEVTVSYNSVSATFNVEYVGTLDTRIKETTYYTFKGSSYSSAYNYNNDNLVNLNDDNTYKVSSTDEVTIKDITFNGAVSHGNGNWLTFNTGATISFEIANPATIYLSFYNGNNNVTVKLGNDILNLLNQSGSDYLTKYAYFANEAGVITITATSNGYLGFMAIVFEDIYYKINLHYNNEDVNEIEYVLAGSVFALPTEPTKTGNTFSGWYSDEEFNNSYDFSSTISSALDLYAKWTINSYKLTLIISSGIASISYKLGDNEYVTVSETTIIDVDYGVQVRLYATAEENYNYSDTSLESPYTFVMSSAYEFTPLASTEQIYLITLDNNNATSTGSTSIYARANSSTLGEITNPVKTDYHFDGWYINDILVIDVNGNFVASAENYTDENRNWIYNDGVTLYAKWIYAITSNTHISFGNSGNYSEKSVIFKNNVTRDNGNDNSQIDSNEISYYVNLGAKIVITSYSGYTNYNITINGIKSETQTGTSYTAIATNDTNVLIETGNNNYFYSIGVYYPISENVTYTFGTSAGLGADSIQKKASYIANYSLYVDATSGKYDNTNNTSWAQFNKDTVLSFRVKANCLVTLNMYDNNFKYQIGEGGVIEASNKTEKFIVTEDETVYLTATENTYIGSIQIEFYNTISESTNITFGTAGTYNSFSSSLCVTAIVSGSNTNNYQVKGGFIALFVKEGAKVNVYGYGGSKGTNNNNLTSYTVTANNTTSATQNADYEVTLVSDGAVIITAVEDNNYLISIIISYE